MQEFYDLPKEIREFILANDNPYRIGGQSTDIGQIGLSLEQHIDRIFPDEVPESIRWQLDELVWHLDRSGQAINKLLLSLISEAGGTTPT